MWSLFASKLPFSWEAGCRVLTWLVNTPWRPPHPQQYSLQTLLVCPGWGRFLGKPRLKWALMNEQL